MSARNYSECPKCILRYQKEDAEPIYGKVSEQEYFQILEKRKKERELESLAEYYDSWIDMKANKFKMYYRCSCEVCPFNYEYSYEEELNLE